MSYYGAWSTGQAEQSSEEIVDASCVVRSRKAEAIQGRPGLKSTLSRPRGRRLGHARGPECCCRTSPTDWLPEIEARLSQTSNEDCPNLLGRCLRCVLHVPIPAAGHLACEATHGQEEASLAGHCQLK